jgi:hypothetical protein
MKKEKILAVNFSLITSDAIAFCDNSDYTSALNLNPTLILTPF